LPSRLHGQEVGTSAVALLRVVPSRQQLGAPGVFVK
jgi:hypothetical protein